MAFNKIKTLYINGRKNLTSNNEVIDFLNPKYIYIPLKGNVNFLPTVKVGDVVLKGQVVANRNDRFPHPIHSSVSGKVTGIKKMWHSSGKMVEFLEIENDYLETSCYIENKYDSLSKEEIIEIIKNAGIVGMGGAGFPTYAKYSSNKQVDVIIINGAECEPYITSDYALLKNDTSTILRGIKYLMKASNASKAVIAIKKNKKELISILSDAINEFEGISLFLLKDVYPAGWEKYIVTKVTKKNYDGLPINVGAIVNNVHTAYSVAKAVEEGEPLIERIVTLSGEGLKKPSNIRVKVGTSIEEVIEFLGGYAEEFTEGYMIAGGPMTGKSIMLENLVITPELGSVLIIPKKQKQKELSCLGCGNCSTNCPVLLTPTEIKLAFEHNDIELLKKLNVNNCIQCGLCSYVCPSRIEMTEYVGKAKVAVAKAAPNK